MKLFIVLFILFLISCTSVLKGQASENSFDFKEQLFGDPSSLTIFVASIDNNTGEVTINGGDYRQPSIPFTFDWGDGSASESFFPMTHIYSDVTRNYLVKVTAHYANGKTGYAETMARFSSQYSIDKISLPNNVNVDIPDHNITLSSRMQGYGIPSSLTYFDDSCFSQYSRSDIEYILTVGAVFQRDFANDNLYLVNKEFGQVLLRDPFAGGMYSLWYTDPISFGVGDYGFEGTVGYSSFFHEMGHNVTLNIPADYYYGGKIDGCANAIYSESMAQIFQHATIYEIINHANTYGLNEDFIFDIKSSGISSINLVRSSYERYVESGMPFFSWNDPNTPEDETFDTFMTIAYKFFTHVENGGLGYRIPLKRMMGLLQTFDEESRTKYDQYNNTEMADTFRATLMVTALSYAFSLDLRNEFRQLNFPISDEIYNELLASIPLSQIAAKTTPPASANVWNIVSPSVITFDKSIVNNFGAGFGTTWIAWRWNSTLARWEVPMTLGSNPITSDPFDAGTSWFYALDGDGSYVTKSVQGTQVDTSTSFSVPLKAGWNLICNPFDFSVAWSDSTIKIKYGAWEGTPTQARDLVYVDNRAI